MRPKWRAVEYTADYKGCVLDVFLRPQGGWMWQVDRYRGGAKSTPRMAMNEAERYVDGVRVSQKLRAPTINQRKWRR